MTRVRNDGEQSPTGASEIVVAGHAGERFGMDRRRFLQAGGSAVAALAALACDRYGPRSARGTLDFAKSINEKVGAALLRHTSIDRPPASADPAGKHFPSYFISPTVPVWDPAASGVWKLRVEGMVRRPLSLSLPDLVALPHRTERVDHFCVEGWTALSTRTGVRLSDLARLAGVDDRAGYVDFESFDDDYHESWDMRSAMHPQTLVVYGQDGSYLNPAWGAPARVFSPIKLGYKNTKYLTRIVFLPERNGGYWSDQGYEWFAGT
jgi:DMSO/TMAO reductase YedYZ molybdopterin-dependent catalytic subunit